MLLFGPNLNVLKNTTHKINYFTYLKLKYHCQLYSIVPSISPKSVGEWFVSLYFCVEMSCFGSFQDRLGGRIPNNDLFSLSLAQDSAASQTVSQTTGDCPSNPTSDPEPSQLNGERY